MSIIHSKNTFGDSAADYKATMSEYTFILLFKNVERVPELLLYLYVVYDVSLS